MAARTAFDWVVWIMVVLVLPEAQAKSSRVEGPAIDSLWTFLAYDIGLEPHATVSIDLSNAHPVNNTYLMMITHQQLIKWHQTEPRALLSVGDAVNGLNSYLTSSWRMGLYDRVKVKFNISAPSRDRYHLGVLNAQQQMMKLSGEITIVNPNGEQLPVQDLGLPSVLLACAMLFGGTCVCLVIALLTVARRGCTAIHLVMVGVLLLKIASLLLHWLDELQVSKYGTDSVLTDTSWQLVDKLQAIMELMMFLLIALGWKFLRNNLNRTEIRFAVGVGAVSCYLGVFEVACTTPSTCSGYQLSRYILHSLCCLVVIVAMNFNLQMLHHQLEGSPASMEAGRLYSKFRAYKAFRWIFLAFIVAPTVELFLKVSVMPWDAQWAFVLLQQLRTWAIFVSIAASFRPDPKPLRVFELTRDIDEFSGEDDEVPGE